MIITILPQVSSVETLLNNLSEAGFDLKTVSVVLKDVKLRNRIAKDAGPLKGATATNLASKLVRVGCDTQDASAYAAAVNQGQALVVIAPPKGSEQAAQEMLADYEPQMIKVLP